MQRRDGAYRVYLAVAVGLVAVAPLVRMLFLALLEPSSLAWLTSAAFAGQLHGLAAAVVPLGLLAGSVRGAALLTPFETVTRGSNHLPRRVTLRRPFLRSLLIGLATSAAAATLIGAALVVGAAASPLAVLGFVAAVAALAGQAVGSLRAWGVAILLGAFGVSPIGVGAWLSWSWAGVIETGATGTGVTAAGATGAGVTGVGVAGAGSVSAAAAALAGAAPLVGVLCLLLVAALALVAVPALLDRLRGDVLLVQARRREASQMAVATGEVSEAATPYREQPTVGRRLPAILGGPRVVAMLVRDAIGSLRTPQRTVLGLAGLTGGALLLGVGADPDQARAFATAAAAAGSVAAYLSLAAFSDGFRQAAEAAAGPAIFGTPVGEQFLLHAAFPLVVVLLVVGVTVLLTGGTLAPLLGGAAMVAVRAFEAARGPLPPLLLTPMPSEVGDLSTVARLAWQFDSVLISGLLGAATTMLWAAGLPVLSIAALAVGASLLAVATRSRLRQSRG